MLKNDEKRFETAWKTLKRYRTLVTLKKLTHKKIFHALVTRWQRDDHEMVTQRSR
jgi:hypothetical protein